MTKNLLNIIHFIRGVDERAAFSLTEPVKEQIKLSDRYGFPTTFLVQYDALCMPEYVDLLKALDPTQYEIGLWYEIPKPLCEAVGIPWTSPLRWDHHCWCDFPVGYPKEQRVLLIDEAFRKFKEVFGTYPRSVGSWFFDSCTIRHIADHYDLQALCNCKEQYGTDGYTLWGGYYGQGYYPAKQNVFIPAQSAAEQIPIPVFRMLGSDPVYQYDFGMNADTGAAQVQGVITLEPVYKVSGGGNPDWVNWYLKENFNGECLSFSYAQAGQENSFGWEAMKDGLTDQFAKFKVMADTGKIRIERLCDTGAWYKRQYTQTPASVISAHTAFDDPDKKSVWYCCKTYRINLYADANGLRIRDIHLFDERSIERYEQEICTGNDAAYHALPIFDGNLFSGHGVLAGIYVENCGSVQDMQLTDLGNDCAEIRFMTDAGEVSFTLHPDSIRLTGSMEYHLHWKVDPTLIERLTVSIREKQVCFPNTSLFYGIQLLHGKIEKHCINDTSEGLITPENGILHARFFAEA